jgi:cytochrome c-type biogenesis protein CcmF
LLALAFVMAWTWGGAVLAPLAIGLAVFVVVGALTDLAERTALFRGPLAISLRRARGLPRSTWGTAIAHAGLGLTLMGIVCETTWNSENILTMKPSDTTSVGGYSVTLAGFSERQGSNYRETISTFKIRLNGDEIGTMTPSKRNFTTRGSSTTEAALLSRGLSQLYISLGDRNDDGSIAVRMYYKPLVLLIWLGAVVMAFGGALSLSDRRLRVGAPQPAKQPRSLQAAE